MDNSAQSPNSYNIIAKNLIGAAIGDHPTVNQYFTVINGHTPKEILSAPPLAREGVVWLDEICRQILDILNKPIKELLSAPSLPREGVVGLDEICGRCVDLLTKPVNGSGLAELALWGLGGSGKTTLAAYLARDKQIRAQYPGGHLWIELGPEFTAAKQYLQRKDPDAYVVPLRTELAQRKVLLIIDDVWEEADGAWFRKLCGEGCGIIFTTRKPVVAEALANLNSVIQLEGLQAAAAEALFYKTAPRLATSEADPYRSDLRKLFEIFGYLPLGINLAGRYLNKKFRYNSKDFKDGLDQLIQQSQERLKLTQDEVRKGIYHPTIKNILKLSVNDLRAADRLRFAELSIFAGPPWIFTEEAANRIWGDCEGGAEAVEKLSQNGLIVWLQDDRLSMHNLVADFASELFHDAYPDTAPRRRQLQENYLTYYLGYVQEHSENYDNLEREFANLRQAYAWLVQRDPSRSVDLVLNLFYFLEVRGHWSDSKNWLEQSLAFCEPGDKQILVRLALSMAYSKLGELEKTEDCLRKLLTDVSDSGDPLLMAKLHYDLGMVLANQGVFGEAAEQLKAGEQATGSILDPKQRHRMILMCYQQLGNCYLIDGTENNCRQAKGYLDTYIQWAADWQFEDDRLLAYTYYYYGLAEYYLNNKEKAREYYEKGQTLADKVSDIENMALLRANRAEVEIDLGDLPAARSNLDKADELGVNYKLKNVLDFSQQLRQRINREEHTNANLSNHKTE